MNKYPSAELIQEVAIELGVEPSFVEKDWYAVKVLKLISENLFDDICPVFSGGTSLSKGYGLIQRFSEDLDFKVKAATAKNRAECKVFRQSIIDLIDGEDCFTVDHDNIIKRDGSKFFAFNIGYPVSHALDHSLRPSLKLEMRFQAIPLASEAREITSFVSQLTDEGHEALVECISPVETAADKFSALMWRIQGRDRTAEESSTKNDPTMIRHLHDFCALKALAKQDERFVPLLIDTFNDDLGRGNGPKDITLNQAIDQTLAILEQEDRQYRFEYDKFVAAMSYADDDAKITYDQALAAFKEAATFLLK